jgi:Transposase and inactivated derivatives
MKALAYRQHDLSNHVWILLEPRLLGRKGTWGGNAPDNRKFINAVFWVLRTGAPWRDLPTDYGDWKNTHRRFCRWRDKGVWENLLETLMDEPNFEWLMIDVGQIDAYPPAEVRLEVARPWGVQKGIQHPSTPGRGCEWSADPS